MFGFNISATSNTSFNFATHYVWTEGDMWLVKAFEITRGLTDIPGAVTDQAVSAIIPGPTDLIEPAFRQLLAGSLKALCQIGNKMAITIWGADNTYTLHQMLNPEMGGDLMVRTFLQNLRKQSNKYNQELGDQVMIQICSIISKFDKFLTVSPAEVETGALWIDIQF